MNEKRNTVRVGAGVKMLGVVVAGTAILSVVVVVFMSALTRNKDAALRPENEAALEAQMQAERLGNRGAINRFLITDINNLAASSSSRFDMRDINNISVSSGGSMGVWVDPGRAISVSPLPDSRPVAWESLRYFGPSYPGGEQYERQPDNPYRQVLRTPLSTFSIDVDTASYSNVRRFLDQHQLPPKDAVRIEELINYFNYDYPQPKGSEPFSVTVDVTECPWEPDHWLARIGLQGRTMPEDERGPANLVFLLDVSGSMQPANKLPLVQHSMRLLTRQLRPDDRVAIVTYAGTSRVALESTPVGEAEEIMQAIDGLMAGGSTHGAGGIVAAYRIARENYIEGGINRVILATDGDFNVGITDRQQLMELIQREAKSNVFLTVLGFGMGNLKDATLETLADRGNGNYAYIDSYREARKVFVHQLAANLVTIAKDVKIQVEFNPAHVRSYRLIGYENRKLDARDFNDDTKDAGEIGAGHSVTALYELVPAAAPDCAHGVDSLRYQDRPRPVQPKASHLSELMTVKIRHKRPEGDTSTKIEVHVPANILAMEDASADYKFAASVAAFGMILRDTPDAQRLGFGTVLQLAEAGLSNDAYGYRAEFVDMVRRASELAPF